MMTDLKKRDRQPRPMLRKSNKAGSLLRLKQNKQKKTNSEQKLKIYFSKPKQKKKRKKGFDKKRKKLN